MFRFWFHVNFKNAQGEDVSDEFFVTQRSDNIFDARAELVYMSSRNPHVFATFTFGLEYVEEWKGGKWVKIDGCV